LLDHATYRWEPAAPALAELERANLPLVIVTSKSRPEVLSLLRELKRREPFVVENGGAVYLPADYFSIEITGAISAGRGWQKVELGTPYSHLVKELRSSAHRTGVRVRGFAQMSLQEVAKLTGLPLSSARRARQREYDEPFLILDAHADSWPRLRREIRRRGLHATRGSRFFHILGANDKGAAVRLLARWFRQERRRNLLTVGLGDSPNDIPLLQAVDLPILVACPGGRYDAETMAAVPGVRRARGVGPLGFNRAVLELLREKRGSFPGRSAGRER